MYTVADFLEWVYPMLWTSWFNISVWQTGYLRLINSALNYIYTYKGTPRNWMIRTSSVWSDEPGSFYASTKYPITMPMTFFCWKQLECIKLIDRANTECCQGDKVLCDHWCDCSDQKCPAEKKVDMIQVGPWSILQPWQFKISWGTNGMWGNFWNYIEGKVPNNMCCGCDWCPQLYFTYVAHFNRITCATDIIPLPDPYIPALEFLVVWFIISRMITHRSGDDLNYIQLADRLLDNLVNLQVNVPTFINNSWIV